MCETVRASAKTAWIGARVGAVIGVAMVGTDAYAGRPLPARAFWAGLPSAEDHAPAHGVRALRPPLGGRVRISGGTFVMGSTPTDTERAAAQCRREILRTRCDDLSLLFLAERPAHDVTVSPFELDRTEVTVKDYGRCVAAGVCSPPGFQPGDPRYDRPDFPATQVRWEDGSTYCSWVGARLPTEAEWEFAARGPSGREYPWGDVYNPFIVNHGALAHDDTDATDGFTGLAPVGSFPDGATPQGLLDMAGNAAEWVADYYEIDDQFFGYPAASQVNPKGPSHGVMHVVRGGSYLQGAPWMRAAARHLVILAPTAQVGFVWFQMPRSSVVGFRCAADAT